MEISLEFLGLTKGESKVYLALLKLGPSHVGAIAKQSNVSYSKIYEILEKLSLKGLVYLVKEDKGRIFNAVEPSKLNNLIDNEKQELLNKKQKFDSILSKLELLSSKKELFEEAVLFKGVNGLKIAYEKFLDGLDEKEIYFTYLYDDRFAKIIDKFYFELFEEDYVNKFKWFGISSKDYKKTHYFEHVPKNMKFKLVDFPIPSNVNIAENKVLQIIWSENPMALLINSSDISKSYKSYFDKVWDIGEELNF